MSQTKKTNIIKNETVIAKPFVKWAGGKRHLLKKLEALLPPNFDDFQNVTYIEPFVGGGAMLFHMLHHHKCINRAIINDINPVLIRCYQLIAQKPQILIERLSDIEKDYYFADELTRKHLYYAYRDQYNSKGINLDERAALFFFLNHTCFNGLYRENTSGEFNVPFGYYKKPTICNKDVILSAHRVLSKIEIFCGDYKKVLSHIGKGCNFIYLDPPYRPLLGSTNFKEYSKSGFGDKEQVELKTICDKLTLNNCHIMMSNSDSTNDDGTSFFEQLYKGYTIDKILAPRFINAYAEKREKQSEIIIRNY